MKKIFFLSTFLLTFTFSANFNLQNTHQNSDFYNSTDNISNAVILNWWYKNSNDKIDIFTDAVAVFSRNKEKAFLIEAGIFNGLNDWFVVAIVNPKKQDVKILDKNIVRKDVKVFDLNSDDISEIEGTVLYSGQGTHSEVKTILQFDENFNIVILHNATIESNSGYYLESNGKYYDKQVDWQYFDINQDGILDLIEIITIKRGGVSRDVEISTKKYLFKNNQFVKINE